MKTMEEAARSLEVKAMPGCASREIEAINANALVAEVAASHFMGMCLTDCIDIFEKAVEPGRSQRIAMSVFCFGVRVGMEMEKQ